MVACDLDVIYVPAGVGRSRASQAPKLLPAPQAKHGPVYYRDEDARFGECHAIKDRRGGNFAFALLRPVASGPALGQTLLSFVTSAPCAEDATPFTPAPIGAEPSSGPTSSVAE